MDVSPREQPGNEPADDTDNHGAGLGADIAGLQWLADCVVALERYRQDREDAGVGDGELNKRHQLTCNSET